MKLSQLQHWQMREETFLHQKGANISTELRECVETVTPQPYPQTVWQSGAWEGREVGGKRIWESFLDDSTKQPSRGSGVPSPFICHPPPMPSVYRTIRREETEWALEMGVL